MEFGQQKLRKKSCFSSKMDLAQYFKSHLRGVALAVRWGFDSHLRHGIIKKFKPKKEVMKTLYAQSVQVEACIGRDENWKQLIGFTSSSTLRQEFRQRWEMETDSWLSLPSPVPLGQGFWRFRISLISQLTTDWVYLIHRPWVGVLEV